MHVSERTFARRRLDAAHAGGDAALGYHLEEADVAGAPDVRATAQLARGADVEHAHFVPVLISEKSERTRLDRLVVLHDARRGRGIGENLGVDPGLDPPDFFLRHRRVVREIEARPAGIHQRAPLLHVRAQHLAQRLVHEVGRGVVAHGAGAARGCDPGHRLVSYPQPARLHRALVPEHHGLDLLGIFDRESAGHPGDLTAVPDLPPRFRVKRRAVEHHDARLAGPELLNLQAVILVERHDLALEGDCLVAVKFRGSTGVLDTGAQLELRGCARALALPLHCRLEAGVVHAHTTLARDVGREVDGEAERVVELEHGLAFEHPVFAGQRAFQDLHAVLQRLGKTLLLLQQNLAHAVLCLCELGISSAHRVREIVHDAVEERCRPPELVAVADGAANDAPEHVTPALVRRNHAVYDQERRRADVVRNHLERVARQIPGAGLARGRFDEFPEQVDLVIGVNTLQHCCDALQAHAGVDTGLGQRRQDKGVVAAFFPLILHEDQVPDLDVTVAVRVLGSRRPAGDARPVVPEDLGARAAGAGVGHLPEVVALVLGRAGLVADADAPLFRHPDILRPQLVGFVILMIDGGP